MKNTVRVERAIKDITQQEKFGGIILDTVQETTYPTLTVQVTSHVLRSQVQVRYEICVLVSHFLGSRR